MNAIALNILTEITTTIPVAKLMEEIIWIGAKGIDVTRDAGRTEYLRMSRAGRDFAMNRRQRALICDYVTRVADCTITNSEVYNMGKAG